jgi:RNA polymerase sigma-70 factor (ECF subfamily)
MTESATAQLTRQALEQLYTRLEKPLFNVLYRWVWDPEEAHDLVQEAFLRLWRMRSRVKLESVEPLAYRIATNLAANRRRSRKLWRLVSLDAVRSRSSRTTGIEAAIAKAQERQAVRAAIERLPDHQRRVILLCEYSGMTYNQIAEALKVAPGTVGSRRNAALKRLRQELAPIMEDRDESR